MRALSHFLVELESLKNRMGFNTFSNTAKELRMGYISKQNNINKSIKSRSIRIESLEKHAMFKDNMDKLKEYCEKKLQGK